MYLEFLLAITKYLIGLNEASKAVDESSGLVPYVNHVPLILEDELQGFIRDETGGTFSYHPATEAEREWWKARPWAHR